MNNNEKYTKYVYTTESGDISMLYGEMPEDEDRMTAEQMRFYLYDKRFQIEWKKEEPREDDEDEVYYAILPVFSEELTPEENLDMIWTAYNYDYINGLEFLSFHEEQLRELLGDQNFKELKDAIEYNESLHRYEVVEEMRHNVEAREITMEEFNSIRNDTEEEYLYVDGIGLLNNHGRSHYDNTISWYLYNREARRWEWDWEENSAINNEYTV
jgi:DNA polymerase III delta prime subunit